MFPSYIGRYVHTHMLHRQIYNKVSDLPTLFVKNAHSQAFFTKNDDSMIQDSNERLKRKTEDN